MLRQYSVIRVAAFYRRQIRHCFVEKAFNTFQFVSMVIFFESCETHIGIF